MLVRAPRLLRCAAILRIKIEEGTLVILEAINERVGVSIGIVPLAGTQTLESGRLGTRIVYFTSPVFIAYVGLHKAMLGSVLVYK